MTAEPRITLREICNRVWRARWKILWYQAIVGAFAVLVILFWPRKYASEAKLFFPVGRESVGLDPTATTTGNTISLNQSGRDEEIISAMQIIQSRGIIGPVVDKLTPDVVLGASEGEPQGNPIVLSLKQTVGQLIESLRSIDPTTNRERAIIKIEKNLAVSAERKSLAVNIRYETSSPTLAQKIVDAIIKEYRSVHLGLHQTVGSEAFFTEQSRRLREELKTSAEQLRESKNRMGLASIDGQRKILEAQLQELRSDLITTSSQMAQADALITDLKKQIDLNPERIASAETFKPNEGADLQRSKLFELQLKEQELVAKLHKNHPELLMVQEQVRKAKAQLEKQNEAKRSETSSDVNKVHQELTLFHAQQLAQASGLRARMSRLEEQEDELVHEIKELNANEVEIEQLTRELKVAEEKYVSYAKNLEEARVDRELQQKSMSSVTVAQAPTLEEKPASPSKGLTIVFAAMLMAAGSIAIGFVSVRFDDYLDDQESVQNRLHLPVLGTIPRSTTYGKILTS